MREVEIPEKLQRIDEDDIFDIPDIDDIDIIWEHGNTIVVSLHDILLQTELFNN